MLNCFINGKFGCNSNKVTGNSSIHNDKERLKKYKNRIENNIYTLDTQLQKTKRCAASCILEWYKNRIFKER